MRQVFELGCALPQVEIADTVERFGFRTTLDVGSYAAFLRLNKADEESINGLCVDLSFLPEAAAHEEAAVCEVTLGMYNITANKRISVFFDYKENRFGPGHAGIERQLNSTLLHETGHFIDDQAAGRQNRIGKRRLQGNKIQRALGASCVLPGAAAAVASTELFAGGRSAVKVAAGVVATVHALARLSERESENPAVQKAKYACSYTELKARYFAAKHAGKTFITLRQPKQVIVSGFTSR